MLNRYPSELTVGEARDRYLVDNGFDLADYQSHWAKVKLGPIPVYFPNIKARRRAVRLHDLHHVATGYDTSLRGEAEIGAWELGAGCGRYWAAWLLNTSAVSIGALLCPRRTLRAFRRGRASQSLYAGDFHDAYLDWTVGELRQHLGLEPAT